MMNQDDGSEKNLTIFIFCFLAFLFIYPYFFSPKQAPATGENETAARDDIRTSIGEDQIAPETKKIKNIKLAQDVTPEAFLQAATPAETATLENNNFVVEFSSFGGTVTKLYFKGEEGREDITQTVFYEGSADRPGLFGINLTTSAHELASSAFVIAKKTENEIIFVHEAPGREKMTKRYTLSNDLPRIDLTVRYQNLTDRKQEAAAEIFSAINYDEKLDAHDGQYFDAVAFTDKVKVEGARKIEKKGYLLSEKSAWAGFAKKYFALLVRPQSGFTEVKGEASFGELKLWAIQEPKTLAPGEAFEENFLIFAGPQRYETLKAFDSEFQSVLSRGFFGLFKMLLLLCLKWLYAITQNYGFAIVLLTIIIKLVFWPLTKTSSLSMKKMQLLAPKQKTIQEKYKNDPQKAQKELMALYKRNQVNPMAGCLPMLIQFPILIAMFRLLPEAIELHGAPFFSWMNDLSAPDHFMKLPFSLPLLGEYLNLLPLVMIASQVGYQKMMPQPTASKEQANIMKFMPWFFGLICYNFSSGLLIYWIFQNLVSVIQQGFINRVNIGIHADDKH